MKLNEEEKDRITRYFEEEIDPYDFADQMRLFLHEVLILQFAAQEKEVEPTICPSTMGSGYYYLTMLMGSLNPDMNLYK